MSKSQQPIPVTNKLLGWVARALIKISGWQIEGTLPDVPKYIGIGAPHTSYWDLPIFLVMAAAMSNGFATLNLAWMGKHTAFRGPSGALFRKLGGIPVNRAAGHHVVKPVLHAFQRHEQLALVLAPEGTTKRVDYWKPGFYYIARLAHVPIVCGFLDYERNVAGIGPIVYPSGDIESDMQIIRDFYAHVHAKYPEHVGEIRLPPKAVMTTQQVG